jgi:hypothetical protein
MPATVQRTSDASLSDGRFPAVSGATLSYVKLRPGVRSVVCPISALAPIHARACVPRRPSETYRRRCARCPRRGCARRPRSTGSRGTWWPTHSVPGPARRSRAAPAGRRRSRSARDARLPRRRATPDCSGARPRRTPARCSTAHSRGAAADRDALRTVVDGHVTERERMQRPHKSRSAREHCDGLSEHAGDAGARRARRIDASRRPTPGGT